MSKAKRVVLSNGCFDILHLGHLHHLEMAKRQGDYLVVAVTNDRSVNKGPNRPYMGQIARAVIVRSLKWVDDVILVDSSLEALKKIKPHVFAKGSEYKRRIRKEDREWCKKNKCRIHFTGSPLDSSTRIHDRIRGR